jgi:WD40 repeat protein
VARLSDLAGGKPRTLQGARPVPQGLAFLPGSLLAALNDQGEVAIWNLDSGRQERVLAGLDEPATGLATSGDGRLIAAGDLSGRVTIWDVASSRRLQQLSGEQGRIFHLTFNSDGSLLAAYGEGAANAISIWDTADGKLLQSITRPHPLTAIAFVPASNRIAVADEGGGMTVYDALQAQTIFSLNPPQPQSWFSTLAFNPDGTLLAAGGIDGDINIYSTADNNLLVIFNGNADSILALAFRPDGKQLAFSGRDGTVRLLAVK